MFNSINVCTFSGNLGQDPSFNISSRGTSIANFSIAISGYDYQKKEGTTMWINCVAFNNMAEIAEKWLQKGTQVIVSGTLKEDVWKDKDQNVRKSMNLIINSIQILKGQIEQSKRNKETQGYNHGYTVPAGSVLDQFELDGELD